MYRAKGVAEEGRKLRPNQTTPAMQKHMHMMKRTLGCPALRTGTVGYQLSPHTHTQQQQSLDYYNSTPYMYIHSTCTYTFSVATRSGPSVELICKAASILHFRVTDHIHVQTTYMYVHVHCATCSQSHGRQLPLCGPTCFVHCTSTWMSRIPNKIMLIGCGVY